VDRVPRRGVGSVLHGRLRDGQAKCPDQLVFADAIKVPQLRRREQEGTQGLDDTVPPLAAPPRTTQYSAIIDVRRR
jgi:hypothetical protein